MVNPTWESLFYLAASFSKFGEEENSAETLNQVINTTSLSLEDFIQTQNYKNSDQTRELQEILESIQV